MGYCECGKGGGVLGIEPTWLWPRRRRVVVAVSAAELGAVNAGLKSEKERDGEV